MYTEQTSAEVAKAELALRQKLEIQFEVMKLLDFLPLQFDVKKPDSSLVSEAILAMWSNKSRGTSNAEIFSDEFDNISCDPVQLLRLTTEPDKVIREIAARLPDKDSFLN